MTGNKWKDPSKSTTSPRYLILALFGTAGIAAGVLGLLADKPQFAELLGAYRPLLQQNWFAFIAFGITAGLVNLTLTLRRR
jgi:hypothetical protein